MERSQQACAAVDWEETSPGKYERQFDTTDLFFHNVSRVADENGRDHWMVNVVSKLDFGTTNDVAILSRLRTSWARARNQFPVLAAEVVVDGSDTATTRKLSYIVCRDATELQQWASDCVTIERGAPAEFRATVQRSANCTLHWFPATGELLMRMHHYLCDGMGTVHLLDSLLRDIARTPAETSLVDTTTDEGVRLQPSFSTMAGLALPDQAEPEDTVLGAQRFANFVANMPSIALPRRSANGSAPTGFRRLVASSTSTVGIAGKVVEACRARELTLTPAVHASMVAATRELRVAEPAASGSFTGVLVYNMRPYLPPPYNDTARFPAGNVVFAAPITLPAGANWEQDARALHAAYDQPKHAAGRSELSRGYAAMMQRFAAAFAAPPPPGLVPACQPMMTSLGLLENKLSYVYEGAQPVLVDRVEMGVDIHNDSLVIQQWSWRDRFYISASYNQAFLENDLAEKFLRRIYFILMDELAIDDRVAITAGSL